MTDFYHLTRRLAVLGLAAAATAGCDTVSGLLGSSEAATKPSDLEPLFRLVGSWRGTGEGEPGKSQVERTYAAIMGGRFIEARNKSIYPKQEKNPNGETHEDVGYISFDRARKRFVLRQFHSEGFVNQYVSTTPMIDGARLIFESEAIENIGQGFRARETYLFTKANEFEEIFEIAEPNKDFQLYSRNVLRRP